ncbi:MAG: ABC transporter ATP-binding protein [Anderseniella sp.]
MQRDQSNPAPAIELIDICKSFGPVRANRDVSLRVEAGTIHGIVGENGAGKSTLMNILYGHYQADSGEMQVAGKQVSLRSSADAISLGIGMVHQHFMLVSNMTVLENVMLGSEGGPLLRTGKRETLNTLKKLADDYGMEVDADAVIADLPVGTRQRVEIIKAIKGGARILILDEPTGVLTPGEADKLFEVLKALQRNGVTVLLITHKLDEIMAITDAVSVMRHGEIVGHRRTEDTSPAELARLMVGRDVLLSVDRGAAVPGEVLLEVSGLACTSSRGRQVLSDISFNVRSGEVFGIAGVSGNGQTELLEVIAGMRKFEVGSVSLLGDTITPGAAKTPAQIRDMQIAHIPEDRHQFGLILSFDAKGNAILGYHKSADYGSGYFLDEDAVATHCTRLMSDHDVRPDNPALIARNFSGGNQQKLVIARETDTDPKILIVGQPTRGVDVGAIEFIHRQLLALRDAGCAILLVSAELDEIIGLSDRIMVMNGGRQMGILESADADRNRLGTMMAGIAEAATP